MRKVAVISSSRADYWLLRPLIAKLHESKSLLFFVSGEHLNGPGINKIQSDGLPIAEIIECLPKDDSYLEMAKAMARGINNFSETFEQYQQDITLLLGDRFEIFAAAIASYALKIPIAHIHGGEVTHGALDDGFRHAISKMASLHFVSHEKYKNRLSHMGENPERIHTVGAIGLDNLCTSQLRDNKSFFNKYGLLKDQEFFLLTLHPSTLCDEDLEAQVGAVIRALEHFKSFNIVVTQSNNDPGGAYANKKWLEWSNQRENVHFIPTLGDDYINAALCSRMVIGNSSSGILEIPYLDRPVLNIGNRQEGRITPKGVYSVKYNAELIKNSIEYILDTYDGSDKIYGIPGQVSEKIFNILVGKTFNNLIFKEFYDAKF